MPIFHRKGILRLVASGLAAGLALSQPSLLAKDFPDIPSGGGSSKGKVTTDKAKVKDPPASSKSPGVTPPNLSGKTVGKKLGSIGKTPTKASSPPTANPGKPPKPVAAPKATVTVKSSPKPLVEAPKAKPKAGASVTPTAPPKKIVPLPAPVAPPGPPASSVKIKIKTVGSPPSTGSSLKSVAASSAGSSPKGSDLKVVKRSAPKVTLTLPTKKIVAGTPVPVAPVAAAPVASAPVATAPVIAAPPLVVSPGPVAPAVSEPIVLVEDARKGAPEAGTEGQATDKPADEEDNETYADFEIECDPNILRCDSEPSDCYRIQIRIEENVNEQDPMILKPKSSAGEDAGFVPFGKDSVLKLKDRASNIIVLGEAEGIERSGGLMGPSSLWYQVVAKRTVAWVSASYAECVEKLESE